MLFTFDLSPWQHVELTPLATLVPKWGVARNDNDEARLATDGEATVVARERVSRLFRQGLGTHFSTLHSCCESQPEALLQKFRHALPLHT